MAKSLTLRFKPLFILFGILTSQVCFSGGGRLPLPCCPNDPKGGTAEEVNSSSERGCQICTGPFSPKLKPLLDRHAPKVEKIHSEAEQIQKMKSVIDQALKNSSLGSDEKTALQDASALLKEDFVVPSQKGLIQDILNHLLEKFPPDAPCCSCGGVGEVKCSKGHSLCKTCLKQVVDGTIPRSKGEVEQLKKQIGCMDTTCKGAHSTDCVNKVLAGTKELLNFNKRVDSALGHPECEAQGASATSGKDRQKSTSELQDKIAQAFNLCCPGKKSSGEACGGVLSPIEGCNAATCDQCDSKFCYLCLDKQPDAKFPLMGSTQFPNRDPRNFLDGIRSISTMGST